MDVQAFTGYGTGGRLVHVSGRLQYLFPSDGGRVTVENISFVEGAEDHFLIRTDIPVLATGVFLTLLPLPPQAPV